MKWTHSILAALGLFLFVQTAQADWEAPQRLTWNSGVSLGPVIALDSQGHVHVAWSDDTPGNAEIYYKKSTDGGATWTKAKRITWTSGGSYCPTLAVDSSDNPYVAWKDDTPGNVEIYCKRSTDGGGAWTNSKRLTFNTGGSYDPALAVDSFGNIHIAWSDATPGNCEVYYKKSEDGGDTWSKSRRLTWTAEWSGNLTLAVDSSGNPYAVWYGLSSPGNAEPISP